MVRSRDRERERLADLKSYRIVGSPAERDFDDIADVAASLAHVPMAYVSFVDETHLWFKAAHGFDAVSIPREKTYCQYVVLGGRPVVISDTRLDTRHNPEPDEGGLAEMIRFYLGVPLMSHRGLVIGSLCVVDTQPRDVPDGLVELITKLARQVSAQLELRKTNMTLADERDTFSVLFEAAPAPLLLVRDDIIVRANCAFTALSSEPSPTNLETRSTRSLFATLPTEEGVPIETTVTSRSGESIPALAYLTRLSRGSDTYDLIAFTDIRDRKEKEDMLRSQRLKAENANRIKDTFLSLVSHDLKSPLSGIFSMLDLLAEEGDSFTKEERDEAIRELRSSVAISVEMINQLLNIHRLQSGYVEVDCTDVGIRTLIEHVMLSLNNQIREKELHIELDVDPTLTMYVDMNLFREAVFNLVSNAIKFSPDRGRIYVGATRTSVWIADEGAGVPVEDREHLFRQEVKTSRPGTRGESGTGLGLPLTADIMKAHGGRVFLDEEHTPGARFVLEVSDR
ncbi:MAG: GAF domain-containing sensor histidine kinase [Spirochaetales bacterium]|nr:GAF domain-containing sensor histidine kinase [Spirochaetales bacterium]